MKLFVLLVLLSAVMAQAVTESCTRTADALTCEQASDALNAAVQVSGSLECTQWKYKSVEAGCVGEARLVNDVSFNVCYVRVPVDARGDVDYDGVEFGADCRKKTWPAGSVVRIITENRMAVDCEQVSEDEDNIVSSCSMDGQRFLVNATAVEQDGEKVLEVWSYKQPETVGEQLAAAGQMTVLLAVGVLFLAVVAVLVARRKR